jgi:hypothetical protein
MSEARADGHVSDDNPSSNKALQATAQTASFLLMLNLMKVPETAATCVLLSRA